MWVTPDIEGIVQQIEEEMKRKLLTQSEVARLAGISRERVWKVLHRRSKSLTAIRAMRKALWPKESDAPR